MELVRTAKEDNRLKIKSGILEGYVHKYSRIYRKVLKWRMGDA